VRSFRDLPVIPRAYGPDNAGLPPAIEIFEAANANPNLGE